MHGVCVCGLFGLTGEERRGRRGREMEVRECLLPLAYYASFSLLPTTSLSCLRMGPSLPTYLCLYASPGREEEEGTWTDRGEEDQGSPSRTHLTPACIGLPALSLLCLPPLHCLQHTSATIPHLPACTTTCTPLLAYQHQFVARSERPPSCLVLVAARLTHLAFYKQRSTATTTTRTPRLFCSFAPAVTDRRPHPFVAFICYCCARVTLPRVCVVRALFAYRYHQFLFALLRYSLAA